MFFSSRRHFPHFPVRIQYGKLLKVLLYSRYSKFILLLNEYCNYPVQEED